MAHLRFYFVENKGGRGARLAAAILSDCLSRQGYRNISDENSVLVADTPVADHQPQEIYVVLHEEALQNAQLLRRLDGRSAVVAASARPASELRSQLGGLIGSVATVDADSIATDAGAVTAVPMLGGAARAIGLIDPKALSASVWNQFDRSLPYAAQAAVRALDLGYTQTQLVM